MESLAKAEEDRERAEGWEDLVEEHAGEEMMRIAQDKEFGQGLLRAFGDQMAEQVVEEVADAAAWLGTLSSERPSSGEAKLVAR